MKFTATNPDGSEPDLQTICTYEEWAAGLKDSTQRVFGLYDPKGKRQALFIIDNMDRAAVCPEGRFIVTFTEEKNPSGSGLIELDEHGKIKHDWRPAPIPPFTEEGEEK